MNIIITGVTGFVGEGVLLSCIKNPQVEKILILSRRSYSIQHAKVSELLVPDFMQLENVQSSLIGYDACFFCAGISSIGKKEDEYTRVTYDTTLHVAKTLHALNPSFVFTYVSGAATDSTETSRMMWARVKGRTENALMQVGFKGQYNFRPGGMWGVAEQRYTKTSFRWLIRIVKWIMPKQILTLDEVAQAMINAVAIGYQKQILEIADIRALSKVHQA